MKIFLNHWNSVMHDVHDALEERGHEVVTDRSYLINPKGLDVALFWNETYAGASGNFKHWGDYVDIFNKKGIRTILFQHGRRGTSRIFPPFNEHLKCQTAMLWGENDRNRYLSVGTAPEKLKVTGTPIFKHLIPRVKSKKPTIVFCPEHWGEEVEENLAIALALRKINGINIITKVIDGEHHLDWYDNPVSSIRNTPQHLDVVAKVLSQADVVVSLSESTFELLGQYLDIPIIAVDIWRPKANNGDENYKSYTQAYSNACTKVKLNELEKAIKFALKHPEHLREERKQICIEHGGTNIGDPIGEIIKAIENGSN